MIDVWSSAGVRLPRSIPSLGDMPMPIDETTFLELSGEGRSDISLGYRSEHSLLSQMIKLNSILVDINAMNEQATTAPMNDYHNYEQIEAISFKLDSWLNDLPDELQDTENNLADFAGRGLGHMFIAVYLGYHNYGQMLFYQFLHTNCHDDREHIHAYANRCKAHATALCQTVYRSYATPGCEVTYTMVGHILVIASSIQLHTLLFDSDEAQIRADRQMLERNFEILTYLQGFWPSLDVCFSRFREFHKTCQSSREASFRMDRWMLRFLLEFAKPVDEKGPEEESDSRPLTMRSFGIHNLVP